MDSHPLHLILLTIVDPAQASEHVDGHRAWLDEGFNDDVFLLSGSIPERGGAVLTQHASAAEVAERVERDPFVENGVVTADVIEIAPSRFHPSLAHLGQ